MTKTENSKTITVYLDEGIQERLGEMAKAVGIRRNRMALNVLIIGLDEAELLKPLVKLVVLGRNLLGRKRDKGAVGEPPWKSVEVWEKPERGKTMTIYMGDDLLGRLDKMVEATRVNRNRLIVNLLTVGLEEAEALRRLGIVRAGAFARDLREKIRDRIQAEAVDKEWDRAGDPRPPGMG